MGLAIHIPSQTYEHTHRTRVMTSSAARERRDEGDLDARAQGKGRVIHVDVLLVHGKHQAVPNAGETVCTL